MGKAAMSNHTLQIYLAAAILVAAVGLYLYSHWQGGGNIFSNIWKQNANTMRFDVPFARFKGAETLRSARSRELIAEIQHVIQQDGLPADVFVDDSATFERAGKIPPPNIAVTLHNLFHRYYYDTDTESPDKSLEQLWNASPSEGGGWDVNPQSLDSVRPTLAQFESTQQAVRNALLQRVPPYRFYYIFIYPESLGMWDDAGVKVHTEASRYLSDYALLEEYTIARALLEGNIAEARDALAYVFRIAQLATRLANVGVRGDAALVRLQAFDVMQRVVLDPNFNKAHMVDLRDMLLEQYTDWTSEYDTWFGDRSSGIVLYHRLVLYYPEDILEEAELNELTQRVNRNDELNRRVVKSQLETFDKGFAKYHEADTAFYLRSMQQILDISKKPLIKRHDVLNQIREELLRMEGAADENGIATEPFVANMLLKDVSRLMQVFARDEAALGRTLALLDASLGHSSADKYRNPFTDEPFEIQKENGMLSITIPELPNPFRVPVFTE